MANTFSIHFVLKLKKVNKAGFAPIFAKVILNGSKIELSTNRMIEPHLWKIDKQIVIPVDEQMVQLNVHLTSFKTKLYSTYSKVLLQGEELTPELYKQAFKGIKLNKSPIYSLIQITTEHNIEFEKQVGKKYSYGSYKNYKTTLKYFQEFVPHFTNNKDISLTKVDFKFCEAYFIWLTSSKNCNTNGANKHMQRLKKILNYSLRSGYILSNPAATYSLEFKPHQKQSLQMEDIKALFALDLKRETLKNIRDIFLFQCYTGLSYGDVYRLTEKHIIEEKGQL